MILVGVAFACHMPTTLAQSDAAGAGKPNGAVPLQSGVRLKASPDDSEEREFEEAGLHNDAMRQRENADFLLTSPSLVRQAWENATEGAPPVWPEP